MSRANLLALIVIGCCLVATCAPKRSPAATVTTVLVQKLPSGNLDLGVVVSWDISGGLMVLRYVEDAIFADGFETGLAGGGAFDPPRDSGGN
jgi:hypothetical protein